MRWALALLFAFSARLGATASPGETVHYENYNSATQSMPELHGSWLDAGAVGGSIAGVTSTCITSSYDATLTTSRHLSMAAGAVGVINGKENYTMVFESVKVPSLGAANVICQSASNNINVKFSGGNVVFANCCGGSFGLATTGTPYTAGNSVDIIVNNANAARNVWVKPECFTGALGAADATDTTDANAISITDLWLGSSSFGLNGNIGGFRFLSYTATSIPSEATPTPTPTALNSDKRGLSLKSVMRLDLHK